jgi:autotransporter-associated beta strand protein
MKNLISHKARTGLLFLFFGLLVQTGVKAQIYVNTFTGASACPTNGNTPTMATNSTGTAVSRATITCNSTANVFNSTTLNNTSSISNTSYIQFSATANSGFILNLTSVSFLRQGSNSAPNQMEVRYSTDGFSTSTTWGSAPVTPTSGTTATWDFADFSTGNGGTVTFRIYPYGTTKCDLTAGAASNTGTFRIDDLTINGTVSAATPSIAISNGTIAAGTPNNGQTNVVLQRYDMAVTSANATLTGLTVTTAGTHAAADLSNLKCWYQTSTTFNAGTATLLSTKTSALGAGSQVFPSFTSQAITSGNTGYIFVTADISSGATNGNTINIASNAFSNISFSSGTKTGTDPVAAGGVQTITVAVPDIALSSPAASAANITVGTTNNVIYRFDLAITTATPSLTGVTINTSTGSNTSGDLTNLKCWYQTSTTFNSGTATLLSTKTTSLAAGSQVFPSFSSQSLTTGSTYYIFITADVPLTATPNNTIIVSAITTSDLTFATGNKTGTANASGTKTIIDCTPADVTSAAASSASSSSVLTWANPACYDEILIVAALASNTGTPTGNGSAYTGNLAYSSGTALGNGFVVYKGSTSSQTVTGLTDGTQYFFKYFTRRGTTWTSGTEVDATPNVAGYYWNGASIAANPAAGGTGTWGTTNSWRQPSSSGAQATWANSNNAVFAGTAGSVTIDADRSATAYYFNTTGYKIITTSSTTRVLTGSINLGNNIGLTFAPNVNTGTPVSGAISVGNISGSGSANITISSAQGSATNIAQRLNIATTSASITVPINITSAGGSGNGTVAAIVATATGTSLSSTASITNNTEVKTVIGATSGFDITANGVISGSADLMFAAGASGGAGTVTLNAANTYTGATIFNAANSGVIRLGITNALPTGTNVTMANSSSNGGIFDLNGFNQTIGSLTSGVGGGSIRNNGATDATLTISGSTSPPAFGLVIADGTTNKTLLTRAGTGTLTLSGANTYTGATTVSAGTLSISSIANGAANSGIGASTNAAANLVLGGGTLQYTGATASTDRNFTLTAATTSTINNTNQLTITGASTATTGALTKAGAGTLILSGTNLHTGGTIINAGTVSVGADANIGNGSITLGGGTLAVTSGFSTSKTMALTASTTSSINVASSQTLTANGIISGNSTSGLTKSGAGTLTLTSGNTYTGLTTISAGILQLNRTGGTTIPITNNVIISGGTLKISTNQTLNDVTLTSGTLMIDAGVTLTITGTITRTSGVIIGSATSNLVITGASGTIAFDQTTPGTTNVLRNLTISGSGTTTLGNALNITAGSTPGVLSVGASATLATGGYLTLKSDANGTARVSEVGAGGSITGNVTVERYIPAKRAWRALTAPLKGSANNSIFYNWQNNGSVTSGIGVELWGPGGTGSAGNNTSTSGLANGPGASIKQYGNGWSDVTDSKTTSLFTNDGNNAYMVFVTGGYGSGNISSSFSDTTLKATGQLRTGDVTYTGLSSTYHTLIGNPYASPISPSSILNGATNLFTNVWVWDPKLSDFGAYVNFDGVLNAYTYEYSGTDGSGGSYSAGTAIQSGQAFFVRAASGTGSLTLTESMKSSSISNTFRNSNSVSPSIVRTSFLKQTALDWMPLDGCIAGFYEGANAAADDADGKKMINSGENIGFVRNAVNLSSEHYPLVTNQDILNLKIWNTQQARYKLKLNTEEFTMTGVEAYLQDLYTGTSQPLNLDGSVQEYEFDVDPTVSASSGNRFRIVFTNIGLSVSDPEQGQLSIYPNPATGGKVTVSLPTGNFEGCSYELINVLGQVVRQDQIANSNSSQILIPLSGLPNSWYALRIRKDNKVVYQGKLIINN